MARQILAKDLDTGEQKLAVDQIQCDQIWRFFGLWATF